MATATATTEKKNKATEGFYWCGLIEACPVQTVHLAGLAFQKYTQAVIANDLTGETRRTDKPGQVYLLKEDRIEKIKQAAADRVVRLYGTRRAETHLTTGRRFSRRDSDVEVSKFVYVIPTEGRDFLPMNGNPETLK